MKIATSSIVPVNRIDKMEELSLGDMCFVTWSDRKKYKGTLLFAGNFVENHLSSLTYHSLKDLWMPVLLIKNSLKVTYPMTSCMKMRGGALIVP